MEAVHMPIVRFWCQRYLRWSSVRLVVSDLQFFVARYLWLFEVVGSTGSSLNMLHDLADAPAFFGRWDRTNVEEAFSLFSSLAQIAVQKWKSMPFVKNVKHHTNDNFIQIHQTTLILAHITIFLLPTTLNPSPPSPLPSFPPSPTL
ncbi:hypothetical protein BDY24DRAFT_414922 [Mrakia frigida]|uniref:uncharacterized protein n=1 Tax=Mrakia frigida TaxID=29902 RepID=UPI003FCBEE3F